MYTVKLVIVFSTVVSSCSGLMCPEGCRCEDSPWFISNCSNSGLTEIPERFPYHSKMIDMSFNRITYLKENLLDKSIMVGLTKIVLAHNFIADIESKAFSYEPRLTEVDLSHNNISRMNSRIFKNNMLLAKVSFRGNKSLYLTHFGGFLQSDSLRELDISHCNIGRVPNKTFIHLPNIERIDLSHNNIATLEPQSFAGLNNLNYLDISNNILSSIAVDVLKSVLHLDQSTLKTEDQRNKRNAVRPYVRLSNNPWACDCQMKKVYEWCMSVGYDPVLICIKPEDLKYKPWEKLGEREDCSDVEEDVVKIELAPLRNNISGRFQNYEENLEDEQPIQPASLVEILIITASLMSTLLSLNFMWMVYRDRRTQGNTTPFRTSTPEDGNIDRENLVAT